MQKDVLGPVLPVLTVNNLDDAIAFINKQEKPLCVYAYSSNRKVPESITLRHFVFILQTQCSRVFLSCVGLSDRSFQD